MIMIPEHSNDTLKLHISDDGDDHNIIINCFQETLAKHSKYYKIKLDNHLLKYAIWAYHLNVLEQQTAQEKLWSVTIDYNPLMSATIRARFFVFPCLWLVSG